MYKKRTKVANLDLDNTVLHILDQQRGGGCVVRSLTKNNSMEKLSFLPQLHSGGRPAGSQYNPLFDIEVL